MKPIRRVMIVLFIFTFSLFSMSVPGNGESSSADKDRLKQTLDRLLLQYKNAYEVPGMAVGVLKEGKVIYTSALGVRCLGTDLKLTNRSLFHMASVSKPFVATAIMQLVEKGKLKLDEKLVTYLPYFKMADERYKDITIAQMLRHDSGMPDVKDYEWDKPQYDEGAAQRYIRSLSGEKLLFKPGTAMRYSNIAYDILADVIARASGMSFETYVAQHIFKPLGMKDSTFLKTEVPDSLINSGHVVDDPLTSKVIVSSVYPYNRAHAPSSTLHSNIDDMMRWGMANLNGGTLDGKQFLKPESLKLMWTPKVPVGRDIYVGLSWFIRKYKGIETISHSGGDVGFATYFVLLPEKKIAITTMGNSSKYSPVAVTYAVLDVVLGDTPKPAKISVTIPMGREMKQKGLNEAISLYHRLKKEQPKQYHFNESRLNQMGYALLKKKMLEEAIGIFTLNVTEHPDSWNVHDSLAEAYLRKGDKVNALKFYKKALELNPKKNGFEKNSAKLQQKAIKDIEKDQ